MVMNENTVYKLTWKTYRESPVVSIIQRIISRKVSHVKFTSVIMIVLWCRQFSIQSLSVIYLDWWVHWFVEYDNYVISSEIPDVYKSMRVSEIQMITLMRSLSYIKKRCVNFQRSAAWYATDMTVQTLYERVIISCTEIRHRTSSSAQ